MRHKIVYLFIWGFSVAWFLAAQTSNPVLDSAHAGDHNVTGKAAPGSTPITVYEVSGTQLNYLGSSRSIDDQGNFAVAVTPLVLGKTIVAKDSSGRTSGPVVVVKQTGPTAEP